MKTGQVCLNKIKRFVHGRPYFDLLGNKLDLSKYNLIQIANVVDYLYELCVEVEDPKVIQGFPITLTLPRLISSQQDASLLLQEVDVKIKKSYFFVFKNGDVKQIPLKDVVKEYLNTVDEHKKGQLSNPIVRVILEEEASILSKL